MPSSPTPPASEHEAIIKRIVSAVLAGNGAFSVPIDDRGPTEGEVLEAQGAAIRTLRGAFDALLPLVVKDARIALVSGAIGASGPVSPPADRVVALWGGWQARGQSADEAREALKDVIRAALIEQAGDADAR